MTRLRASRLFMIKFMGLWGVQDKANNNELKVNYGNQYNNNTCPPTLQSSTETSNQSNHQANNNSSSSLSNEKYANAIKESRKKVLALLLETGAPGMTLSVSRKGETVWKTAFGFCDVENQLNCDPDAHMRIASISKMLFATTAVGPLLESKSVDLKDSIHKFLSEEEFPKQKYKGSSIDITLEQLLSHTSGFKHYKHHPLEEIRYKPIGWPRSKKVFQDDDQYNRQEFYSRDTYRSVSEALKPLKDNAIENKPGEFNYTTYGYTLLSAAIEKVYQSNDKDMKPKNPKQIEDYWIELLRNRWDMKETFLDQDEPIIALRARYYLRSAESGGLINAPYTDCSNKWAGGGINSTTSDLIKFANKLIDSYKSRESAPLKRDTVVNQLWKPVEKDYALGAIVKQTDANDGSKKTLTVLHTGAASGSSSVLTIRPDSETAVAILVNLGGVRLAELSMFIADQFDKVE